MIKRIESTELRDVLQYPIGYGTSAIKNFQGSKYTAEVGKILQYKHDWRSSIVIDGEIQVIRFIPQEIGVIYELENIPGTAYTVQDNDLLIIVTQEWDGLTKELFINPDFFRNLGLDMRPMHTSQFYKLR